MKTGLRRLPITAPSPLAKKLPVARASKARPVWKAVYPITFWNHSGREKMIPNSPRLTNAAAMLPLRNDGMANRSRSNIAIWPRELRWRSISTKSVSALNPTMNATATGDSVHGHDQLPTVNGLVAVHQP